MPNRAPSSTPALVAQSCACFNLRKAARAVTQMYEAALEPSGIRATQLSVLVALSLTERAPLSRVADALLMDRTTLTRNLRPLERRGWVRTERGPDRRERYLVLAATGRAALDRALPLWEKAQGRIVEQIGRARWNALRGELDAVIAAAQPSAAAPAR
jgi:DNA-binding MarR family transcriptional regulator